MDSVHPRLLLVAALTVEGLAVVGLVLAVLTGPDVSTLLPAVLGMMVASIATVLVLTHLARRRVAAWHAALWSDVGAVAAGRAGHVPSRRHDDGSVHDPGWWQPSPHDHAWSHHQPHHHDVGGWTGCDPGPSHHGSDTGSSCSSDSGSSSSDSGSSSGGSSGD